MTTDVHNTARFFRIQSYKPHACRKATTKAELVDLAVRIAAKAPEAIGPLPSRLAGICGRAVDLLLAAPGMANLDRRIGRVQAPELTALDRENFCRAVNRRTYTKQDWRTFTLALIESARTVAVELANEHRAGLRAAAAAADTAAIAEGHAAARDFTADRARLAARRARRDRRREVFEARDQNVQDNLAAALADGTAVVLDCSPDAALLSMLAEGSTVGEAMVRADAAREVERLGKVAAAFSAEACTLDELARAARKREAAAVAAHNAAANAYAAAHCARVDAANAAAGGA